MTNKKLPHRNEPSTSPEHDPAHAEGHRHLAPPPEFDRPVDPSASKAPKNRPWVPRSSFVGRIRRSPHQ
ncbi:MAG: hypothetical protein AB7V43_19235 [Acidimicrobiia bacterium]